MIVYNCILLGCPLETLARVCIPFRALACAARNALPRAIIPTRVPLTRPGPEGVRMPRVREEAAGEPPAKRARPPPSFCRSEKVDSCNRRRPGRGLRTSWWRSCRWPPLFHIFSALAFLFRVCLEYSSSSFFPILRVFFFLIFYFPPSSSILYFCPLPSIHFVLTEFALSLVSTFWCKSQGVDV